MVSAARITAHDSVEACGGAVHILPDGAVSGTTFDAGATAAIARSIGIRHVVLDGYGFGHAYQQLLRSLDLHVTIMDDDAHHISYEADVIVNSNGLARSAMYRGKVKRALLLLGTQYVPIREQILVARPSTVRVSQTVRRLVVSVGGGDYHNMTPTIIRAITSARRPGVEGTVVVGSLNPHLLDVQDAVERSSMAWEIAVDPPDLASEFSRADIAFAAAGVTASELACLGVPCVLFAGSDNQVAVAASAEKLGMAINLGRVSRIRPADIRLAWAKMADIAVRASLAQTGFRLIDGQGAHRIVDAIASPPSSEP